MPRRTVLQLSLLAFVLFSSAIAQKGQQVQEQWKEYSYPGDGFAITAPSDPYVHSESEAPDVRVYTWRFSPDFAVSIHAAIRPHCLEVLAEPLPRDAYVPGSLKQLSLDGNPGIEYESPYGTEGHSAERLYCVKERAYSLTAAYPAATLRPPTASKMFDSFRLVSVAPQKK